MLRISGRNCFFCYLTGGVKWEAEVNLEMLRAHYCKVTICAVKIDFSLCFKDLVLFFFFINLCKCFQCKDFLFVELFKQKLYTLKKKKKKRSEVFSLLTSIASLIMLLIDQDEEVSEGCLR